MILPYLPEIVQTENKNGGIVVRRVLEKAIDLLLQAKFVSDSNEQDSIYTCEELQELVNSIKR